MGGQKGTTTTQTTPNAQALSAYQDLLGRASGVASTPYQAYTGELVAPVNQQQNLGISGVNQFANAAQPAINYATGQAMSSSSPLTTQQIQQYENPFTQQVVNATQNQFNNQNAQQQQGVVGNAIAQGALGGNREAIAQSELANQQQLAQAPVIANLEAQGYNQGVQTAEQQQGIGLQGAGQIGNLGVAGQTAGLQGAGQQIGAGTLQQNTQQALDQALLQQFNQAQAFPYQQTQWLAGLDTGVGSQMGGTSSTTPPAPSLWSQILGAGTAGAGVLGASGAYGSAGWLTPLLAASDVRVKENIRHIGKTHDGQNLYLFNYKGHPQKHVGLIAQEVEHKKPHAVHEDHFGIKHVDYDAATRARGGGVAGYAVGGAPVGVPWATAPTYVPLDPITRGRGAPPPPSVPNQQQKDPNNQAASIGNLAKTLKDSMNGIGGGTPGAAIAGAAGPTSYGGPTGPQPLNGVAPYGGVAYQNSTGGFNGMSDAQQDALQDSGGLSRGGGVGFADGGSPDADNTVINPDEPYRMPDSEAVEAWRNGTDRVNQPKTQPESQDSSDVPVSQGVAPSRMQYSATSNKSSDSVPPEVALGYSPSDSQGVASSPTTSKGPNVDWGADSKLWPSLISAGFGMLASRSPYAGVAIGEGGQAGIKSYNEQQQHDIETQKLAADLQRQAAAEKRAEAQQKMSAINQMIIPGPDGKPMINPNYIKGKQELERDWQPKPVKVGVNLRGDDVQGYWDPNKKQFFDSNSKPVVIKNGIVQDPEESPATPPAPAPTKSAPGATPSPTPASAPAPTGAQVPSSPANATAGAQTPYKVASLGYIPPAYQGPSTSVPFDPGKPVAPATMDNPNTPTPPPPVQEIPPHPADPSAPEGSDASRDTAFLDKIAKQDPALAIAIKKAANYELDPARYETLYHGARKRFMNLVFQYDPNYHPQDVGLILRAQQAFLPGTKTGDTVRAFNTAVSHLDTLQQAYKAVENGDWQTFNSLKNKFQQEFGYAPPNTLNAISQIVGGEVVKATVGAQNALGDREELRKSLEPKLSQGQALDVIDHFQRLMGGQLHSLKFAYEQSTHLHNFDEHFLLPRSREVLKKVEAEEQGKGTPNSVPARVKQNGHTYEKQPDGSYKAID